MGSLDAVDLCVLFRSKTFVLQGVSGFARAQFRAVWRFRFKQVLGAIETHCRVPIRMNASKAYTIDKPKWAGKRVVHGLDCVGKALIKHTCQRSALPRPRDNSIGCIQRRRKEAGISQQESVRWRLRHAHISHAGDSHDVTDAFHSPSHDMLDGRVVEFLFTGGTKGNNLSCLIAFVTRTVC